MYQLICSVLISLTFISARSRAFSSDLCEQETRWRSEINIYIHNCISVNSLLFCSVSESDNVLELTFDLREPGNVTSLEDFHQEITKYGNILNNLDRQLEDYKTTAMYHQQAAIAGFSTDVTTYQDSLSELRVQVSQLLEHLAMKVTGDSQLVASTNNSTLVRRNLSHIFTETHHVSTKLHLLLQQWQCNCMYCLPARDPHRDCDTTTAISNDICF